LERKKNTHKLVAAFQHYKNKHPEIKLVLVGKVGETGQGLNVTGAQVLGYQPTEVVAALLRNALAFVFPSVEEGFGLPIIEAQASGCPVVASNIRVFQEVAREAFLPIEPDNQLDFSHHLSVITNNKDLRTALIEKGLYNAGRYSWDAAAKKVLEIITRR
jgi:glycosyltransferase involved in cell wall biosynthesis